MALCHINHSHTLVLQGIFAFHGCLKDLSTPLLSICLYIDLTLTVFGPRGVKDIGARPLPLSTPWGGIGIVGWSERYTSSIPISNSKWLVLDWVKSVNNSRFHFAIFKSKNVVTQGIRQKLHANNIHVQMLVKAQVYHSNISTCNACISIGLRSSDPLIKCIIGGSGHSMR
jgi:hypothetical protein